MVREWRRPGAAPASTLAFDDELISWLGLAMLEGVKGGRPLGRAFGESVRDAIRARLVGPAQSPARGGSLESAARARVGESARGDIADDRSLF